VVRPSGRPHRPPAERGRLRGVHPRKLSRIVPGELSFFELGVEDPERGRVFYEALFG
jgi:hypothetical protein